MSPSDQPSISEYHFEEHSISFADNFHSGHCLSRSKSIPFSIGPNAEKGQGTRRESKLNEKEHTVVELEDAGRKVELGRGPLVDLLVDLSRVGDADQQRPYARARVDGVALVAHEQRPVQPVEAERDHGRERPLGVVEEEVRLGPLEVPLPLLRADSGVAHVVRRMAVVLN